MLTSFRRILKFAWSDFIRHSGNNFAAIFVLAVPIMLATSLFIFQGLSQFIVSGIQSKIDITAYFNAGTKEEDIMNVKGQILKLSPDIKQVEYVSSDQAMKEFNDRHKDNPDFIKAVDEVGANPFLPSLNIVTSQAYQYKQISDFLQTDGFSSIINKVDYSQKKDTIEKFYNVTSGINKGGLILSIILFVIALIVVLNTIKLSIDASKEEITSMKLVGASNWFIRGPFIIQGAICGLIAFLICFIASGAVFYFLSPNLEIVIPGFNIFDYFLSNFGFVLLIQVGFGVGLGALASFILVRSYLKV
jgi:cell division transport system permease protein